VNNAAQVVVKPAVECTAEDYSGLMATNLESCFHLSQLAHPLLLNSAIASGGSIVHISSIASYLGFPGFVIYSMAKGTNICNIFFEKNICNICICNQNDIFQSNDFIMAGRTFALLYGRLNSASSAAVQWHMQAILKLKKM